MRYVAPKTAFCRQFEDLGVELFVGLRFDQPKDGVEGEPRTLDKQHIQIHMPIDRKQVHTPNIRVIAWQENPIQKYPTKDPHWIQYTVPYMIKVCLYQVPISRIEQPLSKEQGVKAHLDAGAAHRDAFNVGYEEAEK